MKTSTFKMREGSTEFPAHYAGKEIEIEIPELQDTAEGNMAEILRFCAGDDDLAKSRAALVTFSGALKLARQKAVKHTAGLAGSEYLADDALANVANQELATEASRDYGTVKRTAPSTALKAERDAARAAAEASLAALERLASTLKGAARAAVQAEIDAIKGDDTN